MNRIAFATITLVAGLCAIACGGSNQPANDASGTSSADTQGGNMAGSSSSTNSDNSNMAGGTSSSTGGNGSGAQ